MVKPRLYDKENPTRNAALWTLRTVMIGTLKMLHPYMPFITEEIFMSLQNQEETIMISNWPVYSDEWNFEAEEKEIELMKQAVRNIRNIRAELNVPPSKKAQMFVVSEDEEIRDIFKRGTLFFATLAGATDVIIQKDKKDISEDTVSAVIPGANIYIPLEELLDISKEIERLEKEHKKLTGEVQRVVKKLSNQGFVAKAPEHVIAEEKSKQHKYQNMLDQVEERLTSLKK